MSQIELEIQQMLAELAEVSFVAQRDIQAALPAIRRHGESVTLAWLTAARALFLHDRDAGKAFIRGSVEAEAVSETVLPWTDQAMEFLRWRGSWRAVEGFMENLPQAFDVLGHGGEARWAQIGFIWCGRHLASGIAYFRAPVSELAGRQGVQGIECITAPAEELFETRRLALGTYLAGAIRVRNLLGAPAVLPWAQRGADILQAGRLRGEAYFRLESGESLKILLDQAPGYRLPEHERFLSLLLAAWYAEPPQLREGEWSPEKGRAFVETDGVALFIPAAMVDRDEAILAVLHGAGHVAFGSFERRHMDELFRMAGTEPPSLSPNQRVDWALLFEAWREDAPRFQLLFDLCEDLRVDWRVNQQVPNHLRRMVRAAQQRAPGEEPALGYFRWALASIRCALGEVPGEAEAPRWDLLSGLLEEHATVVDAFRTALLLYQDCPLPPLSLPGEQQAVYLPGRSPNAARSVFPRDGEEQGESREADSDERQGSGSGARDSGEQTPAPAQGVESDQPEFEKPRDDPGAGGGKAGAGTPMPSWASGKGGGRTVSERGIPYPEWDYRDQRYKRNWAWIQERVLSESNLGEATRLTATYADALKRLKRGIQAQKPVRLAPLRRQLEGEEVDLDATVSYVTERRAGRTPLPRVYRQRRPRQRDTAVTLLADLSTSVMQQLPDGQGRIVDRIRAGILLFAEAMEVVGDPYSIAGFSSKYRDNVSYYPIKDFDQPFTTEIRATIGGLSGRLATRMGTAIRHALTRFSASPSPKRLLLILSDGRPEDYDDGGDIRYLHEDTRVAVKEAVDQGVHPFCITVDPAGSDYLPRIFGTGHYLVLDHINSLPEKLPQIYLRLRR